MKYITRAALVASAMVVAASAPLGAQPTLKQVTIGLVNKTMIDWPLYIAQAQGFLTANGLNADFVLTGNGASGAQQLVAGSLDIDENSASQAVEAYIGGAPVAVILSRSTSVPYTILGAKGLTSIAQLRGKRVVVGGPNDITRVYMDTVLKKAGLRPTDVIYTYAGGTTERFAALVSGGVDAAILFPPFTFRAQSLGYPVLDQVYKYYPRFPVDGYIVDTTRIAGHEDVIVAFLKSFMQGVHFFYDPANRTRCIQILIEATNSVPDDAAKTYDFLQKAKYFSTTGIASAQDLQRVLDALVETGDVKSPAPATSKWIDYRFIRQANAQLPKQR